MSESTGFTAPPAAIDITAYRRSVDSVVPARLALGWSIAFIVSVLLVAAVVVVLAIGGVVRSDLLIAGAIVSVAILLAALIVAPIARTGRRRAQGLDESASALDRQIDAVVAHLASIGYVVGPDVAADWLGSPTSNATVPLVHDSVIAARWWRPAEGDDRVFLEAFLREGDNEHSLPALAPLR